MKLRERLARLLCPDVFGKVEAAEKVLDPELNHLRLENGKLDLQLTGPIVKHMALVLTETFVEGGATNYIEMTVNDARDPSSYYVVTVQKYGAGAKTPHQLREEAEARIKELESRLA